MIFTGGEGVLVDLAKLNERFANSQGISGRSNTVQRNIVDLPIQWLNFGSKGKGARCGTCVCNIRVDGEEDRLGGAAAVAMIAAGLGARVTLAGVIGRDEPGDRLRRLIDAHGIEPHLWIDDRPTTWKQRIVTSGQLRPDRCDREATTRIDDHAKRFLSAVPLGAILLISDYGKGVCTNSLLQALGHFARAADAPILVDPGRSRNWSDYEQVTLIKANWAEATEAVGHRDVCPLSLVRRLADKHHCHVVVTIGRHGMVCAERDGKTWYLPANATHVRDVCGAGDASSRQLPSISFAATHSAEHTQTDFMRTQLRFQIDTPGGRSCC